MDSCGILQMQRLSKAMREYDVFYDLSLPYFINNNKSFNFLHVPQQKLTLEILLAILTLAKKGSRILWSLKTRDFKIIERYLRKPQRNFSEIFLTYLL